MTIHGKPLISRRQMLRISGWLLLLPLAGLTGEVVRRNRLRVETNVIKLHISDIPNGISRIGEYWINREKESFRIFSANCTHLGCLITTCDGSRLVCRCHGSVFDAQTGLPLSGPAKDSLEQPEYVIDGEYLVINSGRA